MSLRAILFTGPAERQSDEVLEDSEEHFGVTARERYEALFAQAFDDLSTTRAGLGSGGRWPRALSPPAQP